MKDTCTPEQKIADNPLPELAEQIGSIIYAGRKAKGISQAQLGASVGCHQSYIGYLEKGKRSPSFYLLSHILKQLDISISVTVK